MSVSHVRLFVTPWTTARQASLSFTISQSLFKFTADLCLHRRHSNTQIQVWLSLCRVSGSWCAQGFFEPSEGLWRVWGFDSKCDSALPIILLGLLLYPWKWGIFFGGIQHSPIDGCSAVSCNFGVLTGEDEHTSFYSAILEYCWL